MFQKLYPGLPYSELRKSIDKQVTLVAYNKQEIKQLVNVVLMYATVQQVRVRLVNSLW